MKYLKPETIPLDGMTANGLCKDGSTANDDLAKCAVGGSYSDDSCHEGGGNATGGCFQGFSATGLTCSAGGSATGGNFPNCDNGGDYQ